MAVLRVQKAVLKEYPYDVTNVMLSRTCSFNGVPTGRNLVFLTETEENSVNQHFKK